MKNKKNILMITGLLLIIVIGTSYAFFQYIIEGNKNSILVTGDIYMHYIEEEGFIFENAYPMSKEQALEQTNNIFDFQIKGKNTSKKDIYYGISIKMDETPDDKTPLKPSDIVFYLTSGEDILIDEIRYNNFDNPIYVHTIPKNTNSETTKDYRLRAWLSEDILISDTYNDADYTVEDWNNSYLSFKVMVEGTMEKMNMPLTIEHDDRSIENNKQYFIARLSNYLNPEEAGEMLDVNDSMMLEITSDNNNIEFTYKDSIGVETEVASDSLTIDYIFNKKQSEEVKVFVTTKNDTNTDVDVNIKLTKNNEQVYEQLIDMNIKGNNYCLNNGFNKLGDCILVSEVQSESVESAKSYINSKTYNLNDTAPSYTYVENISYDVENPSYNVTSGYKYEIADSIEFDEKTGGYILTGERYVDNLDSKYIGKYTSGTADRGYDIGNSYSYVIKILEVDEVTNKITKGDYYTSKIATSLKSEVGLYKTVDDYGNTYFFRGNVENNNVYFGGYYWKIVRMNGDGSIRLIYSGETKNAMGEAAGVNNTTYTYAKDLGDGIGPRYAELTYVGYMYGENFSDIETTSPEQIFRQIGATTKYYFATDYTWNSETRSFDLKEEGIMYKTVKEMNDSGSFATNMYTCKYSAKSGCQLIIKVNSYINETALNVVYKTYSSISYDGTKTNEKSSNAKEVLDSWYLTNIKNKTDQYGNKIENYIVDGTFCNDRSIVSGDGYNLAPVTTYSPFRRLGSANVTAKLECNSDIKDKFSSTLSRGNGKLTYPIALITADEVVLSGAKNKIKNSDYYLNTQGGFWTMTPSYYPSEYIFALVFHVNSSGSMIENYGIHNAFSLRPIINLSSDVLIFEGDGTIDNPYKLKVL